METDTRYQPNESEVRKEAPPPCMQPEELIRRQSGDFRFKDFQGQQEGKSHTQGKGDKRVMESLGGFHSYRANVLSSPDARVMNSNNYLSF